jgi:Alginate export
MAKLFQKRPLATTPQPDRVRFAFSTGLTGAKKGRRLPMMKTILIIPISGAMLFLPAGDALRAADSTNSAPAMISATVSNAAPSAGLFNDWLREQSHAFTPWDIGGQVRLRLEVKDYFATPGAAPTVPGHAQVDFLKNGGDGNDTYLLTRERLHLGYNDDWFRFYLEGQESTSTGDRRNPTLEAETFNLHQGYVVLGNPEEFPVSAKIGRQEMMYGDERLIGNFDWNNIGRVFDAAKVRYEIPGLWVDAFTSHVIIPRDNDFNFDNNYDTFSGVYASTDRLIPWQESQLYFLARNTGNGSPNYSTGALVPLPSPRDIYTPGLRVKSLPGKLDGFDYGIEADYQFGRYVPATGTAPNATLGTSQKQEAYLVHLEGGYTWDKPWSPRAGLEFNYASGDKNPTDSTHGTFDTLFPTTHAIVGIMDFYSMQNIEDARVNLSVKPTKKFTAFTSFRGVWLATSQDSFYMANQAPRTGGTPGAGNGYAVNPTYNRFVGMEADLVLTYNFTGFAQAQTGYGHFFRGSYIRESLSAPGFGSTDADYVYLQTKFSF